MKKQRKSRL